MGVTPENEQTLRGFESAFNSGDRDAMVELIAPDAEWHPALGTFLTQQVYRGGREICDLLLHEIPSEIEQFQAEVLAFHDAGPDSVIVEVRFAGVGRSSRVPLEQVFFQLYRLREGKVASMHSYPTYAEAAEAARTRG